jgi:hypothetical protein
VPAQASAPSIYTVFKNSELELPRCMARVRDVVAANGFDTIKNATYSTFGFAEDYTIVVRCIPDTKMVLVVVAGPDLPECDRLANKALNQF